MATAAAAFRPLLIPHRPIQSRGIRSPDLSRRWRIDARRHRRGDGDDLLKAAQDLCSSSELLGPIVPKDLVMLAFPLLRHLRTLMLLIEGGRRLGFRRKKRGWWEVNRRRLRGPFPTALAAVAVVAILVWKVKLI